MSDCAESPLDHPVWMALTGLQAHLGHGNALARRYLPDVAPFAGLASETPSTYRALCELLQSEEQVLVPTLSAVAKHEALQVRQVGMVHQMVATRPAPASTSDWGAAPLGASDVQDAQALVGRTRPGPFGRRTLEMGDYIGLRDEHRLVAMAGERMRFEGYVEISAVCVDDPWRGRGMAAWLVNALRARIEARGEVAFLHVLSDNAPAIALYERLGFAVRRSFFLSQIGLADPASHMQRQR